METSRQDWNRVGCNTTLEYVIQMTSPGMKIGKQNGGGLLAENKCQVNKYKTWIDVSVMIPEMLF